MALHRNLPGIIIGILIVIGWEILPSQEPVIQSPFGWWEYNPNFDASYFAVYMSGFFVFPVFGWALKKRWWDKVDTDKPLFWWIMVKTKLGTFPYSTLNIFLIPWLWSAYQIFFFA
jgi:hypothetical protein